jgi:hypothetical protein
MIKYLYLEKRISLNNIIYNLYIIQAWWYMPVIPATQEV